MQLLSVLLAVLLTASAIEAASFGLKIVNGTDVDIASYPFAVSLYSHGDKFKPICGGSILNRRFILTAAHCFKYSKNPQRYNVRYGFTKHSQPSGEYRKVFSIQIHEGYIGGFNFNDIAILKLDWPIEFGPSAQPVKLPSDASLPPVGTLLTAVGWGDPYHGAKNGTDHLKKVQLLLHKDSDCVKVYPSTNRRIQFCAGIPQGGKSTCQGDSGGPLVLNGVQYGVVSGAYGCALPNLPTVFTRVPNYLDWIKRKANML